MNTHIMSETSAQVIRPPSGREPGKRSPEQGSLRRLFVRACAASALTLSLLLPALAPMTAQAQMRNDALCALNLPGMGCPPAAGQQDSVGGPGTATTAASPSVRLDLNSVISQVIATRPPPPPVGFGCWRVTFNTGWWGARAMHGIGFVSGGLYTGNLRHTSTHLSRGLDTHVNCGADGSCAWDVAYAWAWSGRDASVSVSVLPILAAQAIACS